MIQVPPHGMPVNVIVPPNGRPGMVIPFVVNVGPMPPPPPQQQQLGQPGQGQQQHTLDGPPVAGGYGGMPPQMMMGGMRPMQPGIPGVGVPPPGPGRYGGPAGGAAAAVKPREKKVLKITVSDCLVSVGLCVPFIDIHVFVVFVVLSQC